MINTEITFSKFLHKRTLTIELEVLNFEDQELFLKEAAKQGISLDRVIIKQMLIQAWNRVELGFKLQGMDNKIVKERLLQDPESKLLRRLANKSKNKP